MFSFHMASLLGIVASLAAAQKTVDYVIIGGGTAGLTVAARLSEDAQKSVLVLEAGEDRSKDVSVLAPNLLTSLYGDSKYDWNYHTTPQPELNNHAIAHPRGKQLGGSSAINFLWWTHASQKDINNWGLLGNRNWSWSALLPFYGESESFTPPSAKTKNGLQTQYIDTSIHGSAGPILNTFPSIYGPLDTAWPRTYSNLGLAVQSDPRDGLALGGYTNLINMNQQTKSRSYAATTYLQAAKQRPNFEVMTGAHVKKILFDTSCKPPKAIGASFLRNGTAYSIHARHEVILSAGSFGSPQLLELSGIGDSNLLHKHGIHTIVPNPNVGENLQDHAYVVLGYKVREPGIFTLDDFANETYFNESYEKYTTNRTGWLATVSASSALLSLAQIQTNKALSTNLEEAYKQYCRAKPHPHRSTLHSLLCADLHTEAVVQEFSVPGGMNPTSANDSTTLFFAPTEGNYFTIAGVLEHPFSRGSVHINSADALDYPTIDPKYLSYPLDLKMLSVIALHLQKVARTKPLSDLLVGNGTVYQEGYHELTVDNVEDWIRSTLQSEYHPSCTCAMLPERKGGVVDERFKVYGVQRLRVVDASVFPLIPRANLQTLVYAVAERAADFIKEDARAQY